MSYFAEVQQGRVTQVIVAEPEYIATLPGMWVETTHGAYGGVHYNEQGEIDDLPVVRMNYAHPGSFYDEQADVFYSPSRSPLAILDKTTYLWKMCLPNLVALTLPKTHDEIKEVFLLNNADIAIIEPLTWANLKSSLAIRFTFDASQATHALPLSDREMATLMRDESRQALWPMPQATFFSITDRIGMLSLGIPVLPTYLPKTPEDLLAIPHDALFVKRRRTYSKDDHPLAYTTWTSAKELIDTVDPTFWIDQNTADSYQGEFVIQPVLSHPLPSMNLHVAVNDHSEILVWAKMQRTHDQANVFGHYVPFEGDCDAVVAQVQQVCIAHGIKASFHELEFVFYNNEWCLMDWNARLTGPFIQCFANFYPVLDDAFLHVLGRPLRHAANQLYCEQRCYPATRITEARWTQALELGLLPFYENKFIKLSALGESKVDIQSRFTLFESFL